MFSHFISVAAERLWKECDAHV